MLSVNDNPVKMDKSVRKDIACNYYVSGMQGEKKGITLDRNLVEWECEL